VKKSLEKPKARLRNGMKAAKAKKKDDDEVEDRLGGVASFLNAVAADRQRYTR
jgi:hypothetical protein